MGNNNVKTMSFKDQVKFRARQVWNWTKDHAVPLALGTAAAVGGGYLLHRHLQNGEESPKVTYDPVQDDVSWAGDLVDDKWNSMEDAGGPTDDPPEE